MAGSPLRISKAGPADRDAIITLQRAVFPLDELVVDLARGEWLVVRAPKSRALIAFSGGYTYKNGEEHAFVITRQGVSPSHRGLGLQARMLAEHEKRAKAAGIPEVWSYVHSTNVASANSFISRQFRLWRPTHWDGWAIQPLDTEYLYFRKKVIK